VCSRGAGLLPSSPAATEGGVWEGVQSGANALAGLPGSEGTRGSYWKQFKDSYDEIIDAIIRPPRVEYAEEHLGPIAFEFGGVPIARADFEFKNRRGLTLHCSHWHRPDLLAPDFKTELQNGDDSGMGSLRSEQPCLVYLHSHVACRLDVLPLLRTLLTSGVSVLAPDLSGHGMSEGEYVSLGWNERDDVADLLEHLRTAGHAGTIGLWGHYTGAVAALMHGGSDPTIGCLVLEGAVADIKQLIAEWTAKGKEQGYSVPSVLITAALAMVRRTVRQKAGYEPFELKPLDKVGACFIPALFIVANADPVVEAHHGRQLHAAYAGDKHLIEVESDHLSPRSQFLLDSASIFVSAALRVPSALQLADLNEGGFARLSVPWARTASGSYGGGGNVRGPRIGGQGVEVSWAQDGVGSSSSVEAMEARAEARGLEHAIALAEMEAEEDAMLARALALSMQDFQGMQGAEGQPAAAPAPVGSIPLDGAGGVGAGGGGLGVGEVGGLGGGGAATNQSALARARAARLAAGNEPAPSDDL